MYILKSMGLRQLPWGRYLKVSHEMVMSGGEEKLRNDERIEKKYSYITSVQ